MSLHRLIDVQGGKRLHVKSGQPHCADDCHAERMSWVLESGLNVNTLTVGCFESLLHQGAMRNYVNVPLLEIRNLVLTFADYDFNDSLFEPFRLTFEPVDFLCQRLASFTSSRQFRFLESNIRLR